MAGQDCRCRHNWLAFESPGGWRSRDQWTQLNAAEDPGQDANTLCQLSHSSHLLVQVAVRSHPNCPPCAEIRLGDLQRLEKAVETLRLRNRLSRERKSRRIAAEASSANAVLRGVLRGAAIPCADTMLSRARDTDDISELKRLAASRRADVRLEVAKRSNLPLGVIEVLASSIELTVLQAVVEQPGTSDRVLRKIFDATWNCPEIDYAIAEHSNASPALRRVAMDRADAGSERRLEKMRFTPHDLPIRRDLLNELPNTNSFEI